MQPIITYILIYIVPPKANTILTLIISYFMLSIVHFTRMFIDNNNWAISYDIPMMINTLKISSIPFMINDGIKYTIDKDNCKLTDDQKEHMLIHKPSIMNYFSYILFIPTAVVGPYYEFKTHLDFIYKRNQFKNLDNLNYKDTSKAVFIKSKKAIFYLFIYVFFQSYFSYENFHLKIEKFEIKNILSVLFAYTVMFRYLVGWMFTEACLAMCGISLNRNCSDYDGIKIVNDEEIVYRPDPSTIFKVYKV